jgi:hypothetical protein
MDGVREHGESYPVEIWRYGKDRRLVVRALNQGGNNYTNVDLLDLI